MGVDVRAASTPSPNPAGTAVLKLRKRPARAASHAYSATMTCTATNGQKVGFRSEFTADVTTPVAIPTPGPASAVARIVPVVSRKSGSATASTPAESARLIAAATGMRTNRRMDTRRFRESRAKDRYSRMLGTSPIIRALRAAHLHDVSRQDLLRLACERIRGLGAPFTSVYAYMLHDDELVLEAFAGRVTEHTRIPVGQGVCGTAVASGEDQNVPDVTALGNYLACNLETRSELVVLIRRGSTILGQLDIDSDVPAGFTAEHQTTVKAIADALAVLL